MRSFSRIPPGGGCSLLTSLLCAGALLAPAVAHAQIEEIVVTATKREQSLQDVPIAVTALSALQLERAGVKDLRDLYTLAPSFNMNSSQTESQGTTLRIRGVGTTGNNIGLESAVGVFLDGVYLSRPGVALGDLVDIEQIEVLRGPQGTLFGRNTSAGALNIRTRKPDLQETDYWGNFTIGNFSAYNVQLGLGAPLIEDELGLRLSVALREQDGFLTSSTGAESRNRDRISARAQLYWEPAENLNLRLIADYADADERCCDAAVTFESPLVAAGAFAAAGLAANAGVTNSGRDAVENRRSNAEQFENPFDQWGVSAELNWEVGPGQLVWIGSYRDFRAESLQHSDFVELDVWAVPGPDNGFGSYDDIQTMTHELRYQGESDRLDWMVGFYYADEEIEELGTLELGADYAAYISGSAWYGAIIPAAGTNYDAVPISTAAELVTGADPTTNFGEVRAAANPAIAFAGGLDPDGSFAANLYKQDSSSWSIFTHNTLRLSDQFNFVFGLRWIDESKDGSFDQLAANSTACEATLGNAAGFTEAVAMTAMSLPEENQAAFIGGGAQITGLAVAFMCFPFAVRANIPGAPTPQTFANTFEDDELTWTGKLVWSARDDLTLYTSYTHGFKAGGFNLDATAAAAGADPRFRSELVDAWEFGLKSDLLDNTLRLNLAVFHQLMEDFQVLEFTGVQFVTFNVPEVESSGVEVELFYSPIEGLDLSLAGTYADANYPDDCNEGRALPDPVARLCGDHLTNAPEWVGVLGLSWEDDVPGTALSYFLSGGLRYESERRTSTQWRVATPTAAAPNPALQVDDIQDSNAKLNLRVGLSGNEGLWSFELWGDNVLDEQTRNVTFNLPLRGIGSIGTAGRGTFLEAPRTYGATLRLRF